MWPLILWEIDEKHPSNLLRLHRCAYVPTAREGIRCAKISSLLGLVYMYQRSLTSRPRTCLPVCSLQRYDKSFSLCGAPNSISLHDVCCLFPHCLCSQLPLSVFLTPFHAVTSRGTEFTSTKDEQSIGLKRQIQEY